VRIAFDGDAVLFSDEAERVYQVGGLDAFQAHELERATTPLAAGPFKPLLFALQRLQHEPSHGMRIRTALVTARSAPAHERAIRTLMEWHIEVDQAMFLGGLPKGEFLREFEPDFFFDDQTGHIESAACTCRRGTSRWASRTRSRCRRSGPAVAAQLLEIEDADAAVFDPDRAMRGQFMQRLVDALAVTDRPDSRARAA
jgi:hypothetical protein